MKTITLETGELPAVAKVLARRKRKPLWRRLMFELFGRPQYKWHKKSPPPPEPLTLSQIESLSARGAAKRATQKLKKPTQQTDEIDINGIMPLKYYY